MDERGVWPTGYNDDEARDDMGFHGTRFGSSVLAATKEEAQSLLALRGLGEQLESFLATREQHDEQRPSIHLRKLASVLIPNGSQVQKAAHAVMWCGNLLVLCGILDPLKMLGDTRLLHHTIHNLGTSMSEKREQLRLDHAKRWEDLEVQVPGLT